MSPDAKHFRHFSPAAAFFKHATCKLHHPLQILLRPPLAWFLSIQPVLEIYSSSFPPAVAVFTRILTCNRDSEPLPIDWCTGSIRLFPRPDSLFYPSIGPQRYDSEFSWQSVVVHDCCRQSILH
ncbi:hypothetical protein DTO195F2_3502 [Paecilomyces variotii]|nr:hypothetical protein DTO195F2_3502 [Paecilomyces variotii]